jgi:hypothetical protein
MAAQRDSLRADGSRPSPARLAQARDAGAGLRHRDPVKDDAEMLAVAVQQGLVAGISSSVRVPSLVLMRVRPLMEILPPVVSREQMVLWVKWDRGEVCWYQQVGT